MSTIIEKIKWKLKHSVFGNIPKAKSISSLNLPRQFESLNINGKSNSSSKPKYSNILMFPLAANWDLFIMREGLIGYGLKMRGAKVSYVLCDALLTACISSYDKLSGKPDCSKCFQPGKKKYDDFGLDSIVLSKYIDDNKKDELYKLAHGCGKEEIFSLKYLGLDMGKYAFSSIVRRALTPSIDLDNPVYENKARDYLYATLLLTEVTTNMLDELKPDKIFVSHAMYSTWGPVFDVGRKKGIAVDSFGRAYRKDALKLFHNESFSPYPIGMWDKYKDKPLTDKENELLDTYFLTRATQKEDNIQLFKDTKTDLSSLPGLTEWLDTARAENAKLFGMFTNCDWDAAMMSTGGKFENMLEWILETVTFFIEHPEHKLLLKTHPAELLGNMTTPEEYRVVTFLRKNFGDLPSNIFLLPPESTVKPFDIYGFLDFGLIHTSTVSIEMAFNGITVLTSGGGGHYSDKGFTIDPVSKDDYFLKLNGLMNGEVKFKPDIESARRYMFYRFFRECVSSDKISMKHWEDDYGQMPPLKDLLPGKNKGVDIICNGILNDAEFIYDYN